MLASPAPGTPATTLYRYDTQGHLIEEIAGSAAGATGISVAAGQSLVTYVWKDDTPSAVIYAANAPGNAGNAAERIVYLHADHLETPRKASNSRGQVVWSWASDAFGSTAANEDVDGDTVKTHINLRFPGQYLDAESGLHYNWHRYYDAQTGRYVQADPIGVLVYGDMAGEQFATKGQVLPELSAKLYGSESKHNQPYSYADSNPARLTDSLGLFADASSPWPGGGRPFGGFTECDWKDDRRACYKTCDAVRKACVSSTRNPRVLAGCLATHQICIIGCNLNNRKP